MQAPLEQAVVAYPQVQAQRLGSGLGDLITTAPNLVFAPVNYTIVNLRPFDIQVYVACPRVSLSETDIFAEERRLTSSVSSTCLFYRSSLR